MGYSDILHTNWLAGFLNHQPPVCQNFAVATLLGFASYGSKHGKIQYILELMKSRDLFIMPQQIIILNLNEGDFGGDSLLNYILRDLG